MNSHPNTVFPSNALGLPSVNVLDSVLPLYLRLYLVLRSLLRFSFHEVLKFSLSAAGHKHKIILTNSTTKT